MFRTPGSAARRTGVLVALCGLGLTVSATAAAASASVIAAPVPVLQEGTSGCGGVKPPQDPQNTTKSLVGGDLRPGGTAEFQLDFPTDEVDEGGTFSVIDCVYLDGDLIQKYTIDDVPNDAPYAYTLDIPNDAPFGAEYCNQAKTTGPPDAPPGSFRKGVVCFTVTPALRIEKRSGSVEGELLEGATFEVDCGPAPEVSIPPLVIEGLDENGVATTGVIEINGPDGTVCTITETAAPEGFDLPDDASVELTIEPDTATNTVVIVNTQATEGCPEGQEDDGDGGCVTPTLDPEPTDEPVVEPDDPTPTVSPTVLGVKIVKPAQLPATGSPTGLLVALGLALTVVGAGVVVGSTKQRRQH